MSFDERYNKLNDEQRQAVDTIQGPVMVVAGPGSGKTELLGMRVANILQKTDASPQNILCVTYTNAGRYNMRKRLMGLIGQDAYKVNIHTFHSLGSEIISRYPEYFYNAAELAAVDEITKLEVFEQIFNELPVQSQLRKSNPSVGFSYKGEVQNSIWQLKKAGVTTHEFREIIEWNKGYLEGVNQAIGEAFSVNMRSPKVIPGFAHIADALREAHVPYPNEFFPSLNAYLAGTFEEAYEEAVSLNKTKPLGTWRDTFCKKYDGTYVLKDWYYHEHMEDLSYIYTRYKEELLNRGYYDFSDMILDVIEGMEGHESLKAELQEKYQYILVDEFQDTNDGQMRMLHLLTDNPVYEGRPNIMVVGDDDQAIFKFTGAELSNILGFQSKYRDTAIITMTKNYRSTQDVLNLASGVVKQGVDRLENRIEALDKNLQAANTGLEPGHIQAHAFLTSEHQYDWIAQKIKYLIESGRAANEIAVIARSHSELKLFASFADQYDIPIYYNKKRDVLQEPHVLELLNVLRLVQALAEGKKHFDESLLPGILSYEWMGVDRIALWKLARVAYEGKKSWIEALVEHEDAQLRHIGIFFITLSQLFVHKPVETIVDYITGHQSIELIDGQEAVQFSSGFKSFYFSKDLMNTDRYLTYLSHLQELFRTIKDARGGRVLLGKEFLQYIDLYIHNGVQMLDESPYLDEENAVHVVTAHSSKGLEFETVFVLGCNEGVWARKPRPDKLPFPKNMQIKPGRENADDNLRLFFVALTRAKHDLYLTSFKKESAGKKDAAPLSFLHGLIDHTESAHDENILLKKQEVLSNPLFELKNTERDILKHRIENYQMSSSHLNKFLDVEYGGPQRFIEDVLLRFPSAQSPQASYGNVMHAVMNYIQRLVNQNQEHNLNVAQDYFVRELSRARLAPDEYEYYLAQGKRSLEVMYQTYLHHFTMGDLTEYSVKNQGVVINGAHLTGILDKVRFDKSQLQARVFDYKTGTPFEKWDKKSKSYRYKQQLDFYKLLLENSSEFGQYHVDVSELVFLEPKYNRINELELEHSTDDLERLKQLIGIVYQKITNLDFPDISAYSKDLAGRVAFENDLLDGNI
jgi:DNA helicase-2/ATP-dependent DNA helicase PcrA